MDKKEIETVAGTAVLVENIEPVQRRQVEVDTNNRARQIAEQQIADVKAKKLAEAAARKAAASSTAV